MARNLKEVADTSTSDLTAQIETLRNDVAELTQIMSDLGKAKGAEVSDAAKAKLDSLRSEAAAGAERAKDQAALAQQRANDFVQQQPGMALGIAAGVGFLVGVMSGRR